MAKMRGLGASISYAPAYNSAANLVVVIGSLTSIGEISPESEELDATCLDSIGGYREFIQGFKDSGELSLAGYHDKADLGQAKCREQFTGGALGYYFVRFSDATTVAFKAYIKGYSAGSADVDGLIGFSASLRVSGPINVISSKGGHVNPTAPATVVLDATATVVTGTPSYKWYSCLNAEYLTPTVIGAANSATYQTPATVKDETKYYFCEITVTNERPVRSEIFAVTGL